MVQVMVTVKLPPHISDKVIKLYTSGKAAEYPDFVKRIHQWAASDYNFKIYNIYEIPEEKLFQGLRAITKRFSTYVTIKGYKYKIEPLLEGSDVIQMLKS
jgi:hypothetical protein